MKSFLGGSGPLGANYLDMNFHLEQQPSANSPRQEEEQLLDSALANSFDEPSFQNSFRNPNPARADQPYLSNHSLPLGHMGQQTQLHNNHTLLPPAQTHGYSSWIDQATTPTNYPQNYSEDYSMIEDSLLAPAHNALLFRSQGLVNVTTGSSPLHSGDASSDSAAIIEPQSAISVPASGSDGLRFSSRTAASETRDLLYREAFRIKNDDVIEIERNKRQHVKSFVRALNHKDFMAAPNTRSVGKGQEKTLDAAEKKAWLDWQNGSCDNVDSRMAQPNADVNLERRAWEIVDEIVKAHNVGLRHSSLTKDDKSKCSQRIAEGLQVIESYAILRQKLLDGDKISDFAVNPQAYARATRLHLWNNHARAEKSRVEKAEKAAREQAAAAAAGRAGADNTSGGQTAPAAVTGTSRRRRAATSMGAVARRSMSTKDLKQLKQGVPKGRKTKSSVKGADEDRVSQDAIGTTSATLSVAAENEVCASSGENERHDMSSTNPFPGALSDHPVIFRSEPAQLEGHQTLRSLPSGVNNAFDSPDNWYLGPPMLPVPLGATGYIVGSVPDGADPSTPSILSDNIFGHGLSFPNMQNQNQLGCGQLDGHPRQQAADNYDFYGAGSFPQDDQTMPITHSQHRRGEVTNNSDQRVASSHSTYGAMPNAIFTERSQDDGSVAKDTTRKRRRIGSSSSAMPIHVTASSRA